METKDKNRKILLIEPPFYRLFKDTYTLCRCPLFLGYLAGAIKNGTGWDVMAYNADFNLDQHNVESVSVRQLAGPGFYNYLDSLKDISKPIWKEIESAILEYGPDVVGISAKTQNFTSACIVAKLAKKINKDVVVIMGGPHPTAVGPEALKCPDIDICVKGEGEQTIVELLNAIAAQKRLDLVKGIIYREGEHIIENDPRSLIEDLDPLSFPCEILPEALRDYNKYPRAAFGHIFATRGCPNLCIFCGSHKVWGRKVRFRSPGNVVEEIRRLRGIGVKHIHFDDDTLGMSKQYIRDLCNAIIAQGIDIKWSCEVHAALVDEEIVTLMKRAGCCILQIGIESGNNEILKKIRKGITVEVALSACRIIKKCGLDLRTNFMIGFPWETEAAIRDTIKVMKKVRSNFIIYSIFTPYPGTEAFEFCRQSGLIGDNFDTSLYYHQSPANCFCLKISPGRFRILASKIEKLVEKMNAESGKAPGVLRTFSLRIVRKVKNLWIGIKKT